METYVVYCKLKSEIRKKKVKLSDLRKKSVEINTEIRKLESIIEEDMNGLNMVFDHIISQKS